MSTKSIIESVGYIMKKERVASYNPAKETGVMVLEDIAPFTGYYEFFNIPKSEEEVSERSVFLVLKSNSVTRMFEDAIVRKTVEIKNRNPKFRDFDVAIAELNVLNETMVAIRVLTDKLNLLPEIIEEYQKQGVVFAKYRTIEDNNSRIKVLKWMEMEVKDAGIFTAMDIPDTYYLELPCHLTWEQFEEITVKIKNNLESVHFDAAQAALYSKDGFNDFVRVFDRESDLEYLRMLKAKYEAESKRLM